MGSKRNNHSSNSFYSNNSSNRQSSVHSNNGNNNSNSNANSNNANNSTYQANGSNNSSSHSLKHNSTKDKISRRNNKKMLNLSSFNTSILRKYKDTYRIKTKGNSTREDLLNAVTKHWNSQEFSEKDIITHFIYTVKNH
eukprot:jgi/Orpsp1_1/1191466/evm.model.d7180000086013.1